MTVTKRLNSEKISRLSVMLLFLSVISCSKTPNMVSIFDGNSLKGWEGNLEYFRIEDQSIVAGRLDEMIPQNEFLCTTRKYQDFELRLKARLVGKGDNGGIQFRSERVANSNEVAGYQADIGAIPVGWVKNFEEFSDKTNHLEDDVSYPLWGSLYDESRRARVLALGDFDQVTKVLKEDWNELRIRAHGNRIKIWLNDQLITEYEEEENMARRGVIALQVHAGPPLEVWYKDIFIQEL